MASLRRESNSFVFGLLLHRGKKIRGSLVWFRRFFRTQRGFPARGNHRATLVCFTKCFCVTPELEREQGAKNRTSTPQDPRQVPKPTYEATVQQVCPNRSWIRRTCDTYERFHDAFFGSRNLFHGVKKGYQPRDAPRALPCLRVVGAREANRKT